MSRRTNTVLYLLGTLVAVSGCTRNGSGADIFDGLDRADRYAAGGEDAPPPLSGAAFSIDGEPVEWTLIAGRLAEAAGAVIVEEVALDRVIDREAAARGISISGQDLDREREWLARAVARAASGPNADTSRLIAELRKRRGLGPERFAALLRRNALLRAMVRGSVEVTPEQLELAWRVQHGERVRIRLVTAATMQDAQALRTQALAAGSNEVAFANLAEAYSTDSSAPLGGLIEPFSTEDPAYEEPIRRVAAQLEPGQVGPVVACSSGFAVVLLTERLAPDGVTLDQARETLQDQVARRQERIRMDQLANQLLSEAHIRVIDRSLARAVEVGRGE